MRVAVLFAQRSSVYRALDVDVWDESRDARRYRGALPVIAHPPCAVWGRLRHLAKGGEDQRELGLFAVDVVRRCGGVLEHPAGSTLWAAGELPRPGERDVFGGWTLPFAQSWFGHRAPKSTWLYVVGVAPRELPALPFSLGVASGRVASMGKAERERTPCELARWLVDVAARCALLT